MGKSKYYTFKTWKKLKYRVFQNLICYFNNIPAHNKKLRCTITYPCTYSKRVFFLSFFFNFLSQNLTFLNNISPEVLRCNFEKKAVAGSNLMWSLSETTKRSISTSRVFSPEKSRFCQGKILKLSVLILPVKTVTTSINQYED